MSRKTHEIGQQNTDRGDMIGILNFFDRWNEAVADIQRRKQEAADILLHKSTLPVVEIGQILFLNSKTGFSGESSVFINVAGEVISNVGFKTPGFTQRAEGKRF